MRRAILLAGILLVLAACARPTTPSRGPGETPLTLSPVPLGAGERIRVVATTTIVGDAVAQVGGEAIQLTVLLPTGADPHTYEPRPADLAAIAQAHVLFINGLGLEEFLESTLRNVGHVPIVSVSEGIQPRRAEAHEHEEEESHHEEEGIDPHVWMDVRNVIVWTENIQRALSALDPARASTYAANAAAYRAELEALDAWILEQVAQIPPQNRKLVTDHPVFGYFADRYGFEQVATVYPISPGSEPSAREMAELVKIIRQFGVPAVFAGTTVNPKLAEQVARDSGVRLIALYTDSLGGPGSGAESYVAMMRYNVTAMVDTLK